MTDNVTPRADAKADTEQALAGAGASGAGSVNDQAQAGTFTESGNAHMSDVNVQELQSASAGLLTVSAATLKATLDNVTALRATNAAIIDNMSQLNSVHLNNLVNSASHRHSEIAADRQWNLNETDFFAFVTAAVASAVAKNAEG